MPKAVIDTTVLVSAFLKLNQGGVSSELLHFAEQGRFDLYLSQGILDELRRVLLTKQHMRSRYQYPDSAVIDFFLFLNAATNTLPAITISAIFERSLTSFRDLTPNPTATGRLEVLRRVLVNFVSSDANMLVAPVMPCR